jgi:hypothetical protein
MALEEFTSAGSRDFRQRYLDVYGYFPTSNGDVLVKVTSVDEHKTVFTDAKGLQYTAYADKGVMFKFIPVIKRLFFFNNDLCLAQRKPARQYQRGICHANTTIVGIVGGYFDVGFDIINAYGKPVKSVGSNCLLNDITAIYDGTVYLYNTNIGTVFGKHIVLSQPLFKQEVMDAVRNAELDYEVIV